MSSTEYFRLLGLNCSHSLRRRLDCAFYVLPDATPDRYAKLKHNYLGTCPLQGADGLCSLQCECGEEVLPAVCKMYPRNTFFAGLGEGACADSCEKVIELLLSETDGIKFDEIVLPDETKLLADDNYGEDVAMQKRLVSFLQNRQMPISERLVRFGRTISDDAQVADEEEVFATITELTRLLESYSPNFAEYSIIAEEDLGIVDAAYDEKVVKQRFAEAKAAFDARYPDNELYFENILVNHVIFIRFPQSQTGETPLEKYAELCALYALLRFVTVAYTEKKPEKTALVDCLAGLFRCFEHSDADMLIKTRLKAAGKLSCAYLAKIVML